MQAKRPKKYDYIITHCYIFIYVAPLVKLAIVSKSGEEAYFLQNQLVFLHLLYTLVGTQQYIMHTSSYQLSVKSI